MTQALYADMLHKGPIYRVCVSNFFDSDGDGYGDWVGLASKIGYIVSTLHAGAILLAPVFRRQVTHDVRSPYELTELDPRLGTLESFDYFMSVAHANGLKVYMELPLKWIRHTRPDSHAVRGTVLKVLDQWIPYGIDGFVELPAQAGTVADESLCRSLELDGTNIYLDLPEAQCTEHALHAQSTLELWPFGWDAHSYATFLEEYYRLLDGGRGVRLSIARGQLAPASVTAGKLRLLSLLQFTLKGRPLVSYGEELSDDYIWEQDRPMPWNDNNDAGFTTGTPWMALGPLAANRSVSLQLRRPDSMLNLHNHLLHLYSNCPALYDGDIRFLDTDNDNVIAYVREQESQRIIVLLNLSGRSNQLTTKPQMGTWIAGTHEVLGGGEEAGGNKLTLRPYEGRVYESRKRYSSIAANLS